MFRASSCPSSRAATAVAASGLPSELGDSSAVGRGRAGPDHDQQHCYHHIPTGKPEAATAVIELLMTGMRMPETCWAVFKGQVINLRSCCILLVDSVESMMMHGLANPKIISVCRTVWKNALQTCRKKKADILVSIPTVLHFLHT